MEDNKEYYAFISYKREDEKWAKWLQHKLEHYKLPSNLNGRTDLPREIRPVFRDTSELNPGNLPQQIRDALAASKHLIVICSPRSAQSEWVNKEVETFIAMRKQDCIIPFIIDGRPYAENPVEECFPPAIRNLPKEQELLGANITEMGRDAAAVKTVAQMFGVRFDTLWKRHEREQKRKRSLVIAVVALFIFAILGVAAYILRQNTIITKSRAELLEAYGNLSAAKDSIQTQYGIIQRTNADLTQAKDSIQYQYGIIEETNADLRRTNDARTRAQSRAAAEAAMRLLDEGDSFLAKRLALEALGIDAKNEIAERTLREANSQGTAILRNHEYVHDADFSRDGKYIFSFSTYGPARLWDAKTGRCLRVFEGDRARLSPNSKDVAIVRDSTIFIMNATTGQCLRKLVHDGTVYTFAFSSDGKRIASLSNDDYFRIWDVSTGEVLHKKNRRIPGGMQIVRIAFSPDGKYFVLEEDHVIEIFDAINYQELKRVYSYKWKGENNPTARINSIDFSPDGKYIVVASNHISILDIEKAEYIRRLDGHTDHVYSASFSNDGKMIVSASYDSTIRIWDATTGQCLQVRRLKDNGSFYVSFSPDNKHIVVPIDSNIHIMDVTPGQNFHRIKVPMCFSATFCPNGKYIVSTDEFGGLSVFETVSKKKLWNVFWSDMDLFLSSAFSPDGKRIIAVNDDTIYLWDALTGNCLQKWAGEDIQSALYSPNGRFIASISKSGNNTIKILNSKNGVCIRTLEIQTDEYDFIKSARFSKDSKNIVAACYDSTIRIWNVNTGKLQNEIKGLGGEVRSVAYSIDGKRIISVIDSTFCVLDATSGKRLKTMELGDEKINHVAESPDGKRLVTTSDSFSSVSVWDAATGKHIYTFSDASILGSAVKQAEFSPDSRRILLTTYLGPVIWEYPPLEELLDETRTRFKDNPLTPEERRKYYLE